MHSLSPWAAVQQNGLWVSIIASVVIAWLSLTALGQVQISGAHEQEFYGVLSHNPWFWYLARLTCLCCWRWGTLCSVASNGYPRHGI